MDQGLSTSPSSNIATCVLCWNLIGPIPLSLPQNPKQCGHRPPVALKQWHEAPFLTWSYWGAHPLAGNADVFAVRIGIRLYAHKGKLDEWLLNQIGC